MSDILVRNPYRCLGERGEEVPNRQSDSGVEERVFRWGLGGRPLQGGPSEVRCLAAGPGMISRGHTLARWPKGRRGRAVRGAFVRRPVGSVSDRRDPLVRGDTPWARGVPALPGDRIGHHRRSPPARDRPTTTSARGDASSGTVPDSRSGGATPGNGRQVGLTEGKKSMLSGPPARGAAAAKNRHQDQPAPPTDSDSADGPWQPSSGASPGAGARRSAPRRRAGSTRCTADSAG